tara:strand:- start:319 stop:735 length:417 start_codon:yes stop_codon:yes gene_type:complete
MALQYSVTVRNAQLDAVESTISSSAKLRLYSGSIPANCAAAATGTMLINMTLPADWMAAASAGSKALSGSWTMTGDAGAGSGTNAGYFRVWDSGVATTHIQGTVTITGDGGDMTLDNPNIASGQTVSVTTFTLTAGNA